MLPTLQTLQTIPIIHGRVRTSEAILVNRLEHLRIVDRHTSLAFVGRAAPTASQPLGPTLNQRHLRPRRHFLPIATPGIDHAAQRRKHRFPRRVRPLRQVPRRRRRSGDAAPRSARGVRRDRGFVFVVPRTSALRVTLGGGRHGCRRLHPLFFLPEELHGRGHVGGAFLVDGRSVHRDAVDDSEDFPFGGSRASRWQRGCVEGATEAVAYRR
mmetsp:Transcript_14739/g.31410  ORF Transcript_14739/g.31410 Transcript_14739/m.31410 type:complete len:212 (-) Transcript_14739:923-1558(-)